MTVLEDLKWVNKKRSEVIGGTDMAVIMGLSKWKNRAQLLQEKRGLHWTKETEAMGWGLRLEEPVANYYLEKERRNGMSIYLFSPAPTQQQVQHPDIDYFVGSPDRLVCEQHSHKLIRGLEIKTSNEFMKKQWDAGVPKNYNIQCQFYMMVTGTHTWDLACLVGGNKYYQFTLEKEPFIHEEMIELGAKFYKLMTEGGVDVEPERKPEPQGSGGVCIPFGRAS